MNGANPNTNGNPNLGNGGLNKGSGVMASPANPNKGNGNPNRWPSRGGVSGLDYALSRHADQIHPLKGE